MLVATPRSPSLLILEPEMPQTGRHLPKSSRKEGTRLLLCWVIALHTRHRAAPPGSRWGGVRPDWADGEHVLCSPAPVLNHSLLDASPCGSGPFLSLHCKQNKTPSPPSWAQGLRTHEGQCLLSVWGGNQKEVVSPSAA